LSGIGGATLLADSPMTAEWYTSKVAPVLKEKCVACHGPVRQEAGLRLDGGKLVIKGSDEGSVIDSKDPENSRLMVRVRSTKASERMPPEGEGVPLNQEQLGWLRDWISNGTPVPDQEETLAGPDEHWAFQPIPKEVILEKPSSGNVIDAILNSLQHRRGIAPLSPTDAMTLLRRVTFDLSGLPPTREEIVNFLQDTSPEAYEKKIDQLLSRPSYGERWGRHWMDVWRYSDWDGYKEELRGSQRNIWHWREWIVQSLNSNKPYDQMVMEMLAADELMPLDPSALRATGFLARNYHRSNRHIWLDATVEHTAKAFLGLTVNCSKCHDHKYDPISQMDYYRFRAVFEPHQVRTDPTYGSSESESAAFPRAFDSELDATTYFFIRGDDKHPDKSKTVVPGIPESLPITSQFSVEPVAIPLQSSFSELQPEARRSTIESAWKRVDQAKAELDAALQTAKSNDIDPANTDWDHRLRDNVAYAMLKLKESQASLVAIQDRFSADVAKHIQQDERAATELAAIALKSEQEWKSLDIDLKLETAKRTLRTAEEKPDKDADKKKAAIAKAKRELTAVEAEHKKLHAADGSGKIKTYTPIAKGYPRTSTGRRAALARWITDANNPLTPRVAVNHIWARHFGTPLVENVFDFGLKSPPPELLDVLDYLARELLRSNWDMKHIHRLILQSDAYRRASTGSLDRIQAARERDPDNRYYWRFDVRRLDAEEVRDGVLLASGLLDTSLGGPDISEADGEKTMRRSLYFRHAYEKQMTMMLTFDAASPNECYRRKPSIIPQQALALANSSLTRKASMQLGSQIWNANLASMSEKVESLFLRTLSRQPSAEEQASCQQFVLEHGENENTFQSLAHVLMNHNDFVSAR
jgi:hypothetical protein